MSITVQLLFLAAFTLVCYLLATTVGNWFTRYCHAQTQTVENHLRQWNRFNDAGKLVSSYVIGLCVLVLVLFLAGAGVAVIIATVCAGFLSPRFMFSYLDSRRAGLITKALPDALAQISAAMRAGSTFYMALQAQVDNGHGALEQEFAIVLHEQRIGLSMEKALDNLAERVNTEEIDLMVSAASIAQEVGGNLAETLQSLSETIRQKSEMEGKIASLTAQGRLQGYVVSAMPFLMLLGLSMVEPNATLPIFQSLLGWIVLAVILVLQVLGALMIRKIVSIDI